MGCYFLMIRAVWFLWASFISVVRRLVNQQWKTQGTSSRGVGVGMGAAVGVGRGWGRVGVGRRRGRFRNCESEW